MTIKKNTIHVVNEMQLYLIIFLFITIFSSFRKMYKCLIVFLNHLCYNFNILVIRGSRQWFYQTDGNLLLKYLLNSIKSKNSIVSNNFHPLILQTLTLSVLHLHILDESKTAFYSDNFFSNNKFCFCAPDFFFHLFVFTGSMNRLKIIIFG